ncbi:hypothetical protein OF83DRAFT_1170190 [Amylostereum chailletii]|nr:hypothetical protein OF83DRAFT_1170190 [Amylostereum chailletii]
MLPIPSLYSHTRTSHPIPSPRPPPSLLATLSPYPSNLTAHYSTHILPTRARTPCIFALQNSILPGLIFYNPRNVRRVPASQDAKSALTTPAVKNLFGPGIQFAWLGFTRSPAAWGTRIMNFSLGVRHLNNLNKRTFSWLAFQLLDDDNTGKISLRNLRRMAKDIGDHVKDDLSLLCVDLSLLFSAVAVINEGEVNEQVFISIMADDV